MKKIIPITLIAAGAVLIALPVTYAFVLRQSGSTEPLPFADVAACQYGGFSLVAGALLLAVLLPEKRAVQPMPSGTAPASASGSVADGAKAPASQTEPPGG